MQCILQCFECKHKNKSIFKQHLVTTIILPIKKSRALMNQCSYANISNTSFNSRDSAPGTCNWSMTNIDVSVNLFY